MRKMHWGILLAAVCLLAALVVLPGRATAQGGPGLPHSFYGSATMSGAAVPAGVPVEARGAGVLVGVAGNPFDVNPAGQYGGATGFETKLVVQGNVADGTSLTFYVNGFRAQVATPGGSWLPSYPFTSMAITELNLNPCSNTGLTVPFAVTISRAGNAVKLDWANYGGPYDVRFSTTDPYFTPRSGDAEWLPMPTSNTATLAGQLGVPATHHFYVVQAHDCASGWVSSARTGAFEFTLTPGQ